MVMAATVRARAGRLRLLCAGVLALGLSIGYAAAQECPPPTSDEAEAVARAYFDAFNAGDADALDQLLADDYRHEGAVVSDQDRDLHLERLRAVRSAFPDGVYMIDWIVVDDDTVAIRHRFQGTHEGDYVGVPASGEKVAVGAFHVHRIECGKIAETWNAGDGVGLFRQIGAIPGPSTTPPGEEKEAVQAAPDAAACPPTSPEENAATARRWYDEGFNQNRFEVLDEFVAEDAVHHSALMADTADREETRALLASIVAAFPDIQFSVEGVVAADDMVLIRWAGRGTHSGPAFIGVPTSGKTVDWKGINAFRFDCGKIVEAWSEANGLHLLRQLGAAVP